MDNGLFEAINAVVMIQEDKAGTEPDSDPEASASDPEEEEDSDVLDVTAELGFGGSKRSRQRNMVVMKEILSHKPKREEEQRRNRVLENTQEKPSKATYQNKIREEKKPVEESSTDEEEEEEEEEDAMNMEEDVEAMEAKLGEKMDLVHEIVRRKIGRDGKTEDAIGIDDQLKFVKQQGDDLIACLSEIVHIYNRLRQVPQEIE